MASFQRWFLEEFESTLTFSYHSGNVCEVPVGYTTNWRTVPFTCIAQTTYTSIIHLDARRQEILPGEACVIPQSVHHRIDQVSDEPGISRFAHINYRILGCIDALALFEVPLLHRDGVADRIGSLCADLSLTAHAPDYGPMQSIRMKSLGFELLWTIAQASQLRPGGSSGLEAIERLRPVYRYIHEALGERITLTKLAGIADLSVSRFHAIFKAISGQAPQRFIQRLRQEKAQRLLIETGMPIKEVALAVGHGDEFHFSRSFKRMCGANPSEYRRTARMALLMPGPVSSEDV